jgi:hypothetical protein
VFGCKTAASASAWPPGDNCPLEVVGWTEELVDIFQNNSTDSRESFVIVQLIEFVVLVFLCIIGVANCKMSTSVLILLSIAKPD